MTKIKICGITNIEDAQKAVSSGADALGFVFANSPRRVNSSVARSIIEAIEDDVLKVGVFVNETIDNINKIVKYCSLDAVQLHGDETAEYCSKLKGIQVIKAFRIKDKISLAEMALYKDVFAYLLDTFSEDKYGGTGKTFDWSLAVKAKEFGRPVILSGGLGPDNISLAIKTVRPYGVDISSSIEVKPGKKDHALMAALIRDIKALDE